MEYEDTNILRTQYVDDLVEQRQNLEDVMLYQGALLQDGAGLKTLVPMIKNLTGTKVFMPVLQLGVYKGSSNVDEVSKNVIESINKSHLKSFNNLFYFIKIKGTTFDNPLDLRDLNIQDAERLINTFNTQVDYQLFIKLPTNFNLSNVHTIKDVFGKNVIITNIHQLPKHIDVSNLTTFNGAFALSSDTGSNYDEYKGHNLMRYLYGAKPTKITGLVNGVIGTKDFLTLNHIKNNWDLSQVSAWSYIFNGTSIRANNEDLNNLYIRTLLNMIDFSKPVDLSHLFYIAGWGAGIDYGKITIDLSDKDLDNVKNFSRAFAFAGLYKFVMGHRSKFGLDETGVFDYGRYTLKILDVSRAYMGLVASINNFKSALLNLEEFYIGADYGKGFKSLSANNSAVILTLTNADFKYTCVLDLFINLYDLNVTYDVANGGTLKTQQIDLHADVIAQLTPEEIAIATNKGWTVL